MHVEYVTIVFLGCVLQCGQNHRHPIVSDEIALLEPDERLLRAGAAHEPVFLRGRAAPIETLLQVETMRLQVKQNARISHLRLFRFDAGEPIGTTRAAPAARKSARRRAKAKRGRR